MRPLSKGNISGGVKTNVKSSVIARSMEKVKKEVKPTTNPSSVIKPKLPPPTQIVKQPPQPKLLQPKPVLSRYKGNPNSPLTLKLSTIPFHYFDNITVYAISSIVDVLKLSHVCRTWKNHIYSQDGPFLWRMLKESEKIVSIKEMKMAWKDRWVQLISKNFQNHQKLFCRLFDYGSTKENIPNKLIKKLDLEIGVRINKMELRDIPFGIKTFNFSSYLTAKVVEISQLQFDFNTPHNMFKDKIELELTMYSRTFMFKHTIKRVYLPQNIYKQAIRQKAFNYYLDKNFILTFFQSDNHFLYLFMQFSLLQIINQFRNSMKLNKDKLPLPPKSIKLFKQLSQTKFQSFTQYFKYQADFQLHFSFHNSIKQIFTHCDTKVYPLEYNNKSAFFSFKIRDSFPKQPTYKLDNKMGMSESVKNLFLLDLVVKDRDRFLVTFSGFIFVRVLGEEEKGRLEGNMEWQGKEVMVLGYKEERYGFEIVIVDEGERYFVPTMTMEMRAKIIQ